MGQWGNTDSAADSVSWVGSLVNTTANTATQNALFNNVTMDDFVDNVAIGQFGVSEREMQVVRAASDPRPAHAGWVVRKEGMGGRAGRVQYEVLVAMSSITGDASDDAQFIDAVVIITRQPEDVTVTQGNPAVFTIEVQGTPADAPITYLWSFANGDPLTPASFDAVDQPTITIDTSVLNTTSDIICTVSIAGGVSVTSDVVTLTVTT